MNVFDNRSDAKKVFASFKPFDSYMSSRGFSRKDLKVAETSKGNHLLKARGEVIASIKDNLKGSTLHDTTNLVLNCILSDKGATFGIPAAGSVDMNGNPALPCFMEAGGDWKEKSVFSD